MKTRYVIILLSIVSFLIIQLDVKDKAAWAESPKKSSRIVGGDDALPGDWPWMAAIIDSSDNKYWDTISCGGSLIHPRWIVSAAHCMYIDDIVIEPDTINIVLNINDINTNTGGERIRVKRIIIHPDYDSISYDSDIALIELEQPASSATIPVLTDFVLEAKDAVIMGWGDTSIEYPEKLQQASIMTVSNDTCNESFNTYDPDYYSSPVTENMLCAGLSTGEKDACQGDSGGPLIVQDGDTWELAGITSWGEGCAQPGLYGVYTRISSFADFIAQYLPLVPGDINKDFKLGLEDVIGTLQTLADLRDEITDPYIPGDFNSDSVLGLDDAIGILHILTGKSFSK